jgi:energy-coupling factor transport system substrate-specific component
MTTTYPTNTSAPVPDTRWRTRDIVVAAVIGVAFGVVFQVWNLAYGAATPIFAFAPPVKDVLYGVWLVPAVLAPLIVRKPGAALFAEIVAAGVSALLGSQFGADALLSGLLQGAGAEVVFAVTRYRVWTFPVLVLAATGSAVAAWLHDWVLYYADTDVTIQIVRGIAMVLSAAVIAAGGSVLLARSLRRAGVLEGFPD